MNRIARQTTAALLVVLSVVSIVGCGRDEPEEEVPVVRPIKMMEVSSRATGRRLEYPGRVSPIIQSELSFEVPGRITYFPVREGQWMTEGEVIARLDDSNYRAEVTSYQARLDAAKADYERFKALLDKGAVSQRDLESRQRNYEVAKSNFEIAEKALQDTELRAHFNGRVARKLVDEFQNVLAKTPVVLLQDDRVLEIKADVPERALASNAGEIDPIALTRTLAPLVSITAIPDKYFPAQIKEVATTANPTTRTFEVTFSFAPDGTVRILPGMTARITVELPVEERDSSQGFMVPSNATVIDDQGKALVWRVNRPSMQVQAVPVELGSVSGGQVTVYGGLSDGDLIAISAAHHLRAGMEVRRMPEKE